MALTDNLISHWKLNEASNGTGAVTRNDSHGANHLTDTNTVASAAGKIDDAASFVRANTEYLSLATVPSDLQVSDVDWALAFWVYPTSAANTQRLFVWGTQCVVRQLTSRVVQIIAGGSNLNTTDTLTLNAWNLVIIQWVTATKAFRVRINNGTQQTLTPASAISASTSPFTISNSLDTFDGRIDSVSFWKRLLTSPEEGDLWNGGNGLDYPFSLGTTHAAAASLPGGNILSPVAALRAAAGSRSDGVERFLAGPTLMIGTSVSLREPGLFIARSSNIVGASSQLFSVDRDIAQAGVAFAAFSIIDGATAFSIMIGNEVVRSFNGLNWQIDKPDSVPPSALSLGLGTTHLRIV